MCVAQWINLEIKRREFWRPLAPSTLKLDAWTTTPSGAKPPWP